MIFIVEDDDNIRELESYALRNSGYEVLEFSDGKTLIDECAEKKPELVILDIMLPETDGITLLKQLKESHETNVIPVIFITAKTSEMDMVKGLDLGADDYITKPFGVMQLVSRVKALLRRTKGNAAEEVLKCGDIEMNVEQHTVTVNGGQCRLTYKEFEILKLFMKNRGKVFSRDKLMEIVWGFDYQGETRTVDMHIKTLRAKLGDAKDAVQTVRNVGYKLDVNEQGQK